jgi:hypothetical protein
VNFLKKEQMFIDKNISLSLKDAATTGVKDIKTKCNGTDHRFTGP